MTDEDRLREILRAAAWHGGDWAAWRGMVYDHIPVMPRMVMAHVYGQHDDTPLPYEHCVLCTLFRVDPPGDGAA